MEFLRGGIRQDTWLDMFEIKFFNAAWGCTEIEFPFINYRRACRLYR